MRTRPKPSQKIGVWISIVILGIILFSIVKSFFVKNTGIISPLPFEGLPKTAQKNQPVLFKKKTQDPQELISQLKELTGKQQGIYSIYIYDLTNDTGFGINETTIFTAASVNKIPILAALYSEAQRGRTDLDRRITLQASDIQNYGTGILRYQGPGGVYSLKTLAQMLMEKSDNTAAFVLTGIIGEARIQELVESWGMSQTDIHNNKTSPKDITILLTKMYKRQIAAPALTTEMIGFMDNSDFENRLPALLPKDIPIYHKIGNEIGNIHDAGIVALPNHSYIISVMTNDVTDEPSTEVTIAQISLLTFDYMNTQ